MPCLHSCLHTSSLTPIYSSLGTLLASLDSIAAEHFTIWIIWIFFLITAALVTVCSQPSSFSARPYTLLQKQFSNLKWCRSYKVCSVLETIKAFGWICWGLFTILLVVTLIMLLLGNNETRSSRDRGATAYTGRQTSQSNVQPVTQPVGTHTTKPPTTEPV